MSKVLNELSVKLPSKQVNQLEKLSKELSVSDSELSSYLLLSTLLLLENNMMFRQVIVMNLRMAIKEDLLNK